MAKLTLFALLFCVFSLHGQVTHCVIYTVDNDTVVGFVRYKDNFDLQNNGMQFVSRTNAETLFPPSSMKEAYIYLTISDPLRVVSVPKTFVSKYMGIDGINTSKDTHLLIKTDTTSGPVQCHSVCTGFQEEYSIDPMDHEGCLLPTNQSLRNFFQSISSGYFCQIRAFIEMMFSWKPFLTAPH